jgi:hypothetical protein
MKRLVHAIFFIFCAIAIGIGAYYVVRERSGTAASSRPITTRQVVASPASEGSDGREAQGESESSVNRIDALPNEVILNVMTVNLDTDEGDEQILTVRKTDRPDGLLNIVVADYVPQRRAWVRSWEGETLATKPTTFSIQAEDMFGDHDMAIVCTGMNEMNEQTISIFRRKPDALALTYSPVCSIAADAVEIEKIERSEGYQLGQTGGASWPILSYVRDKESVNLLDQVKTVHVWSERSGSYAVSETQRIPGAQVERNMIAGVLTGSEEDFEAFLQGVWYANGTGPFAPEARLIVFDRITDTITFHSSEAQEVFTWTESNPTRYGLYASSQNESVPNLRRLINIELTGSEAISVRVFQDVNMKVDAEDRWNGGYLKLSSEVSNALVRSASGRAEPDFKLDGPYRADDGTELVFARPHYTLRSGENTERGAFNSYRLGDDDVIEFTAIRENGLRASRRTYRARFAEQQSGRALVRTLVLSPARAAIDGLEILGESDLVLEQRVGG